MPTIIEDIEIEGIRFVDYKDESQLDYVMSLVGRDLSEPYSIFTYRYFLHRFPELCIFAVTVDSNEPIGCVVGKIDEEDEMFPDFVDTTTTTGGLPKEKLDHFQSHNPHKLTAGYIGMLAVSKDYRRRGIGKALVQRILRRMKAMGCCSATLETEVSNTTAQLLYEDCFGFIREELLVRYYLNWSDAYRLRLWF